MGEVHQIKRPPTFSERVQMSHDTEVSSDGDDGYMVFCSCGWDTGVLVSIRSEADAQTAADEHRRVMELLKDPDTHRVLKVHLEHDVRITSPMGGGLQCSCGEWEVKGYPIGHDTALKLWKVHYAQAMLEAMK